MRSPDPVQPASTKDRILDAAEALFADHGFDGTSLRAVTGAADVNLAAVHYHFGSKTGLFEAVIRRRVDGVNAERLRRLDEALARANPAPVAAILAAFLAPVVGHVAQPGAGFDRFQRLIGRIVGTPGPEHAKLRPVFQGIADRFLGALHDAAPHLTPADLHWRFQFLLGSMCHAIIDPGRIAALSGGLCSSDDPEETLRQLVAYAAAGFAAPSPSSR
jgi:AcrR family transcriptional regulator